MRILIDTTTEVQTKRSGVVKVSEALAYLHRRNDESLTALVCRLVVASYTRQKALDDDKARAKSGKVAAHRYKPRLVGTSAPEAAKRMVQSFKTRIDKALA